MKYPWMKPVQAEPLSELNEDGTAAAASTPLEAKLANDAWQAAHENLLDQQMRQFAVAVRTLRVQLLVALSNDELAPDFKSFLSAELASCVKDLGGAA